MNYVKTLVILTVHLVLTMQINGEGMPNSFAPTRRIVGGHRIDIDKYPFVAGIKIGNFFCGGSILTSRDILSALHCFTTTHVPLSQITVLVGNHDISQGKTHSVKGLTLHEVTKDSFDDIALVHVNEKMEFNARTIPASLPSPGYDLPYDSEVVVLGWGATSSGGRASDFLLMATVKVVDTKVCKERYQRMKYDLMTENAICAGLLDVGGKDACQGDSGGPLVDKNAVLVGITSFGIGCGEPSVPGVYTKVSNYINWINSNILMERTVYFIPEQNDEMDDAPRSNSKKSSTIHCILFMISLFFVL